jgi:predicted Abi (CAAX) family protease
MLFLRGDFLVLAAILGLFCGLLRLRSGGLWTAIVLHWLVVVIWKAALSGPSLADLTDFASP